MSTKGRFEELNSEVTEDFLDVDKPIPGQNFACISFVSPDKILVRKEDYYFHEFTKKRFQSVQLELNEKLNSLINESLDGKVDVSKLTEFQKLLTKTTDDNITKKFDMFVEDLKDFKYANEDVIEERFHEAENFQTSVRGVKIRGVYNTIKEAQIRAKVLQRMDPSFHIFVGQVGYWLPWDPSADKIENQEYQNGQLNEIVKKYKANEAKRDEFFEQQKQDVKKQAAIKSLEKKSTTEEKPKLSVGDSTAPEVSLDEAKASLTQEDPWMASKLNKTTETTEITESSTNEVDDHEETDE
jgi:hypothetical protein